MASMASRMLLVALLLAFLAASAHACIVPPGGCKTSKCASYAGLKLPDTTLDYTQNSTWSSQALLALIGWYEGLYNPTIPKPGSSSTFAAWKKIQHSLPSLNYEKYFLEAQYILANLSSQALSLKGCCDACREAALCVEYRFQPLPGATTTDDAGQCYLLTGGNHLGNGPYNLTSGVEYGTPGNVGNYSQQQASSKPAVFVGGGCNPLAGVTDDPHFTGAHGTKYDFNGELDKSFCLVTDNDFHINALLKGYKSDVTYHATVGPDGKAIRSWIHEVGFLWKGGHKLHMVARDGKQQGRGNGFIASATLDGTLLTLPTQVGQTVSKSGMSLTFQGVGKIGPYEIEQYGLKIDDYIEASISLRVAHQLLQTPESAEVHFNLKFDEIKVTPKVHGVLGQTYRDTPSQLKKAMLYSELSQLLGQPIQADGPTGQGFLEGSVQDYESTNVLQADCRVSAYSS
jgi:hypothetical protein